MDKLKLRLLEKKVVDTLWDVRHILGVMKTIIHDFERVERDLMELRDEIQKELKQEERDG
jgi:hypothetical protein